MQDKQEWNIYSPNDKENIAILSDDDIISQEYFRDRKNIHSVHFCSPNTEIESATFSGCEHLTNVVLPYKLKEIKPLTFAYCKALNDIDIPNSVVMIGNGAFLHCDNLKEITIHGNIGEDAFAKCENLTSIKINENTTEISNGAFSNCKNLTSITILHSQKSKHSLATLISDIIDELRDSPRITISDLAFSNCIELTSIIIEDPNITIHVTKDAFFGLTNQVAIKDSSGDPISKSNLLKIFDVKTLENFTWLIKPKQ